MRVVQPHGEANTVEEKKAAVTAAKEAREKIAVKGKLATILDETIATIETGITTQEKEDAEKLAAQEAGDAKAIDEMHAQERVLLPQLKFAEARAVATAVSAKGEKAKHEQQSLLKRADALAKFKTMLVADVNAATYPQKIVRKNGQAAIGVASKANEVGVALTTPYGNSSLVWTEFSLDTMYKMGRYFIRPEMTAEVKADRQWLCGTFAILAGKKAEARELLNAAAGAKPQYKDDLPLFLEAADAP